MAQRTLRFEADKRPANERFPEFIETHPEVWERFKELAWEDRNEGERVISSDGICHVLRREFRRLKDIRGLSIDNDFTALFSRKLVAEDPTFKPFFRQRKSKWD